MSTHHRPSIRAGWAFGRREWVLNVDPSLAPEPADAYEIPGDPDSNLLGIYGETYHETWRDALRALTYWYANPAGETDMDAKIDATTYIDRAIDELLKPERAGDLHMILRSVLMDGVYLTLKSDLDVAQDLDDWGDCAGAVEDYHARYAPELTPAEREALARDFGLTDEED